MNKTIYILYMQYTDDVRDMCQYDAIGYFESRELADEAMKTMEPEMEKRRKELIKKHHELSWTELPMDNKALKTTVLKEVEELYSDEFLLSISVFPLNVVIRD